MGCPRAGFFIGGGETIRQLVGELAIEWMVGERLERLSYYVLDAYYQAGLSFPASH